MSELAEVLEEVDEGAVNEPIGEKGESDTKEFLE